MEVSDAVKRPVGNLTSAQRYRDRRDNGCCPGCGDVPDGAFVSCSRCRRNTRKRRAANKAAGRCPCGNPRAPGRRRCGPCIARDRRRQERFLAQGRCRCGNRRVKPGCKNCVRCLVRAGKPRPGRVRKKRGAAG